MFRRLNERDQMLHIGHRPILNAGLKQIAAHAAGHHAHKAAH
jgi:hypothetical protein